MKQMKQTKTTPTMIPMNQYETSFKLFGARQVLMHLHDAGTLKLDAPTKDAKVYNEAAFQMLLHDDDALLRWLALPTIDWEYYGHEKDKKGKLVRCKARML